MGFKTITVTDEAYNAIKGLKQENESFSELFKRMGTRQLKVKDILRFAKHTPEEAEEFRKRVLAVRKQMNKDMEERIKRVRAGFERTD